MSSSWTGHGPSALSPRASASTTRQKKVAARQLLSCTKCRERKVKCDRIQPCAACSARGCPSECEFIASEGNDYQPIAQSYRIKDLEREVERLRERLIHAGISQSDDEDQDEGTADRRARAKGKQSVTRQRRFKTYDRSDNIYFGTPGLATVVHELANLRLMNGAHSLTHPMPGMPKGKDIYGAETSYPFHVVVNYSKTSELLELLPPERDELIECLDLFKKRAQPCSFPQLLDEVTKMEVERFLTEDREQRLLNAENYPDMLALIFATLATGLQMGQFDKSGGKWEKRAVERTRERCDAFITASMQMLRISSFLSRPSLLAIQTLIMMGPYLTNTGRFLDAWTLFGTTIRLAHSVGLHRDPSLLDPAPPLREARIRQTLWWWMLHMDQQYSITLGRPLGISGYGDCPQPQVSTTNATKLRLYKFNDEFTIVSRQALASAEVRDVHRIDDFTDKIINLWETMPQALQFNVAWLQETTQLPEWPLEALAASLYAKVQSLLILLNRQRLERVKAEGSPGTHTNTYNVSEQTVRRSPIYGRALVINCASHVLETFLFFYHRNRAVLICWTMGQQAFNAAMILLLDAWEMDYDSEIWIVEQAYAVFVELAAEGVHTLAKHAQEKIFAGLQQIRTRKLEREMIGEGFSGPAQGHMSPDTAPMMDLAGDTVMGSAGMFLLEDPGFQFQSSTTQHPNFRPWGWNMPGSAHPSNPSGPPSPDIPSPTIPMCEMPAAPFPIMQTAPISPYAVGLQPRMAPARRSTAPHAHFGWHPGDNDDDMQQQSTFTPVNNSTASQPHYPQQTQNIMGQQLYFPPQPGMSYHPAPPQQATQMQRASSRQHQQQQQQQSQQQQPSFSQLRGLRHSHASVPAQQHLQGQHEGAGIGGRPRMTSRQSSSGPKAQRRSR